MTNPRQFDRLRETNGTKQKHDDDNNEDDNESDDLSGDDDGKFEFVVCVFVFCFYFFPSSFALFCRQAAVEYALEIRGEAPFVYKVPT